MPSKIVEVKNLNVIFGQHQVLDDLSFDVNKGEVLAIIGPNGAGKTVLFHALIGLSRPTSGVINWKCDVTDKKIKEFLDLVGIDHEALNKGISQLSVGQRQRVLVAWAVMNEPEILLFDEPTADIDIRGQQSIYHLLHKIQDQIGFAVILISHDLSVVYKYADQVLCLNSKRVCMGPPREVLSAEQLLELYGGEQTFYKHLEKSFHEDHHA